MLWRRYGRVLRRGGGRVDLAVRPQDPRLKAYLTAVVRLPAGLAARLAPVLEPLAQSHPGHHIYPPETMHLTVLDCSSFLAYDGGELEQDLRRLAEILAAVLADTQPVPVEVRELNVFPASVFAQVYDPTGGLYRLRRRLRRRLLGDIRPGPVASLRDRLAFTNLVRFAAPVAATLVAEVARHGRRDFGGFVVRDVELVLTDKALSVEGTKVVRRYRLGGRP